ncbi:hypothetical protein GN244_ATG08815 [Phytophthora infestans]|uniref:Uncharacterized protein n=1 Tax=Phytophthora infestans TaxID=4787 RepID=A0A833SUT5_PHYIN|nr:hypothetical protein GN244_ATG08815 [Phytophthora infestans]
MSEMKTVRAMKLPKTLPALHDSQRNWSAATATIPNEAQTAIRIEGVHTDTGVPKGVHLGTGVTDGVPVCAACTAEVDTGTADEVTKSTEEDAKVPADAANFITDVPTSSASEGSDSPRHSSFTLTKSSKSRGRPKVRK